MPGPRRTRIGLLICAALGLHWLQAQGDSLGRLFTTEEQRRVLQELKGAPEAPPADRPPAPVPAPAPRKISLPVLHGIVWRQDGRHTVWLQDRSYYLPEQQRLQGRWKVRRVHGRGVQLQRLPGAGAADRQLPRRLFLQVRPGRRAQWTAHSPADKSGNGPAQAAARERQAP